MAAGDLDLGTLRAAIEIQTTSMDRASAAMKQFTTVVETAAKKIASAGDKKTQSFKKTSSAAQKATMEIKKVAQADKLAAAASFRKTKALANANIKYKDQVAAIKRSSVEQEKQDRLIKRATSLYNGYVTAIKKGSGATDQLARSNIKLRSGFGRLRREITRVNTEARKNQLSQFNRASQDLTKSVQLALGPLSGYAARITAFTSLVNKETKALAILIGVVVGLTVAFGKAVKSGATIERAMLRIEGQVKATGKAAGFTARQLNQLAIALGRDTLTSAEKAREAISVLLVFTKVVDTAFTRTLKLAQDLTDTFGGDLAGNVRRLGRALEDPVSGLEQLSRSGITFTKREREVVKILQEANETLLVQSFILARLELQIGGNAVRAAQGLSGAWDSLKETAQNFFDVVGTKSGAVSILSKGIRRLDEGMQKLAKNTEFMAFVGLTLKNTIAGISAVMSFLGDHTEEAWTAFKILAAGLALNTFAKVFINFATILRGIRKILLGIFVLAAANPFTIIATGLAAATLLIATNYEGLKKAHKGAVKRYQDMWKGLIKTTTDEGEKLLNKLATVETGIKERTNKFPTLAAMRLMKGLPADPMGGVAEALEKGNEKVKEEGEKSVGILEHFKNALDKIMMSLSKSLDLGIGDLGETLGFSNLTKAFADMEAKFKKVKEELSLDDKIAAEWLAYGEGMEAMVGVLEDAETKAAAFKKALFIEGLKKSWKDLSEFVKATKTPVENHTEAVNNLNNVYKHTNLTLEEYNSILEKITLEYLEQAVKFSQVANIISDNFTRAIMDGENLRDTMANIGREIVAMTLKMLIFKAVMAGAGFSGVSLGGTPGKSAAAATTPVPGRAHGGPVTAGQPFLVGERGPELFVPGQNGNVVSNKNMGGGVVVNIDARGASLGLEDRLEIMIRNMGEQTFRRSVRAVSNSRVRNSLRT